MTTKAATSLALTVNELLTNAIKHAGRARAEGSPVPDRTLICITMARTEADVRVVVQDNGPGFPDGFDAVLQANIGLQLIQTLVEYDLQGTVEFGNTVHPSDSTRTHGASVEILFPISICANV
jgi:two-component sensor histidine kinase